eukprot:CAMPEP_0181169380 /NCGR_PEP_ID=MMETSP1096-20121128/784_1 /TAXON_ID=156174 ORGANISM="Chrysochromulina ericina, Strain CCMP281" /NCGR_SAMPLE_ID=MMETSP1096 /ASSEMBLY_ACC=CAM_ASM_000453 /LENGTH=50 /DNA_ID=CAMNT_0023256835 /DNA_START=115 /DNA_END=267 /DNA_ORIENTATION=+
MRGVTVWDNGRETAGVLADPWALVVVQSSPAHMGRWGGVSMIAADSQRSV